MSTDSSSKQTVTTAPVIPTKQSAPAVPAAQVNSASNVTKQEVKVEPKYKSEDFNGAPIVKLKLKQKDTMQYDPIYHLKLDSTEATELPLTPFFAERIGRTIELCA